MAAGAGPYTGYSKNYKPIKSSKGTKAEKVVRKVLKSAGGGIKPTRDPLTGKMTKPVEAGLGVGAVAKASAREIAKNMSKRPPAWYAKPGGKIRGQGDLSTAAGRAKTGPKNESKLEARRMPLEKALAKRPNREKSQILPKSVSVGKRSVPVKVKTSPKKKGK